MQVSAMQHASALPVATSTRCQACSTRTRVTNRGGRACSYKLSSVAHLGNVSFLAPKAKQQQQQRQCNLRVKAIREWPDPDFINEVEEAFPDQGIANVEEARALVSSLGWTYLDVRSQLEVQDVGRVKDSVNIPMVFATKKWDSGQQKKVVKKEDNPNFIREVEKRFPDKETPLVVGCSNGKAYSMDALEALDEAGYYNLAGLKGGYYAWFNKFDHKGNRRKTGEYAEQYSHDGDSAGIHSSGAGFPKVDPADKWVPAEY